MGPGGALLHQLRLFGESRAGLLEFSVEGYGPGGAFGVFLVQPLDLGLGGTQFLVEDLGPSQAFAGSFLLQGIRPMNVGTILGRGNNRVRDALHAPRLLHEFLALPGGLVGERLAAAKVRQAVCCPGQFGETDLGQVMGKPPECQIETVVLAELAPKRGRQLGADRAQARKQGGCPLQVLVLIGASEVEIGRQEGRLHLQRGKKLVQFFHDAGDGQRFDDRLGGLEMLRCGRVLIHARAGNEGCLGITPDLRPLVQGKADEIRERSGLGHPAGFRVTALRVFMFKMVDGSEPIDRMAYQEEWTKPDSAKTRRRGIAQGMRTQHPGLRMGLDEFQGLAPIHLFIGVIPFHRHPRRAKVFFQCGIQRGACILEDVKMQQNFPMNHGVRRLGRLALGRSSTPVESGTEALVLLGRSLELGIQLLGPRRALED